MTDIALLWRPEQAEALRACLGPTARTIPLSQKACRAALLSRLPNVAIRYFDALRHIDLPALRKAAESAVRLHEAAGGSSLDRPAIWHNAHEAEFVRAAAELLIWQRDVSRVFSAADPSDQEFNALAKVCTARKLPLDNIVLAKTPGLRSPPNVPGDLLFQDAWHAGDDKPWRFILAVALADLADQMRKAAARGPVVVAVDAGASGDSDAIHTFARNFENIKILPLSPSGLTFNERGENSAYATEVERQLARAFIRPPAQVVVSDLRRVETILAVRAALGVGVRPTLRAHGGGVMTSPYRFDETEVTRSVWTRGARELDGADVVESPRHLRPPPPHRLARLAMRTSRLAARPRLGVTVTSGELFAAPEAHLSPMIELFGKLCAAVGDADVVLRLRRLEDCAEVWRSACPQARFKIETRDDRPYAFFARDCDLIVELGAESSAQLEAAANAVPYVRIDQPPEGPRRFLRKNSIVPLIDVDAAAKLLSAPLSRTSLGIRQFRVLERDTRPF